MNTTDSSEGYGPFEGPEKLLEIWFAPSPADLPDAFDSVDGKFGLRKVPKAVWEEMLDIVKCKILSHIEGHEMDAYLLSESSFFVSPHRLILKTCGTTLNLLGLPRILEIAKAHANLSTVYRCFYSRKAFMFPERQLGPHRDWRAEVEYLDQIFPNGAAYTVGKVNGDHWLLYITGPGDDLTTTAPNSPAPRDVPLPEADDASAAVQDGNDEPEWMKHDYTIEILMTELSPSARAKFNHASALEEVESNPGQHALDLSSSIGITDLFPRQVTTLDAYSFSPCGYSSNALLKWRDDAGADPADSGEGYYTIHVTPEDGWSYASFECNVPLPTAPTPQPGKIPDLKTLIRRVVNIFQPGRLTMTLFISSADNANAEEEDGESAVEAAQRAFKTALVSPKGIVNGVAGARGEGEAGAEFRGVYKRTDKINYEFGGYDLAFASFELRS
ncbi:S-adenosylmethionine decarboxylase [Phanerochaete sordida]|uniref:S-adenosylmethionine decarboxylase n=1 Tax=Phanerochaete sordida TaxID=48140 RepID=A0A9P3GF46_9APHY|nr:S-adenosylmethionine decarboxylase [Phanerochaete sordida]